MMRALLSPLPGISIPPPIGSSGTGSGRARIYASTGWKSLTFLNSERGLLEYMIF